MKIFITGIAGFLGSHLADALISAGHEVSGLDDMSGGCHENVPLAVQRVWTPMSCQQIGGLDLDCDVLIHTAALPHEGLSVFSPSIITESIYGASVAVFSKAIAAGVRRIVNLSSMARYGIGRPPFLETDEPKPRDPYAIAKLAAEQTLHCLCKAHGVEYVIAVPHSIIGERQAIDPFRNVATIFANRMLQGQKPIIYGTGEQRRAFSYVGDVVPSLVQMATSTDQKILSQVINIGPDEETISINELFEIMRPMCGYRGTAAHVDGRPLEVKHATCSSNKARELLGYETTTSTEEGLARLVADIKKRGPRPFTYHLPIEIRSSAAPKTWTEKLL